LTEEDDRFSMKRPARLLVQLPGASKFSGMGRATDMSRSHFTTMVYAIAITLATSLAAQSARAQAAATKDKDKAAPPEDVKLTTKDGWEIHATYYAGKLKKNAVPFIMLHGWEGTRADYDGLAKYLQSLGHAAIVPDLRGHGQSNTRPGPKEVTVESPDDLTNNEVKGMVADVEACKKFLREKNNAGDVNIEMLTVVGADVTCITALQWSAYDWNVQNLPTYKQGKDVKMVVLLSPTQSFKGSSISPTLTQPAIKKELTIVIIVGREDSKSFADARKMNTQLENFRPEMKKDDVKNEDRSLFFFGLDTNLVGTDLLNEALKVKFGIANIVKLRLSDKKDDFAWIERRNPISGE
jgi:hypothetical protein